jgi:hypothetical protein
MTSAPADPRQRRRAALAASVATGGLLVVGLGSGMARTADAPVLKIVTQHHTPPSLSFEMTEYLQADRRRVESRSRVGYANWFGGMTYVSGPRIAMITRCDLGRRLMLNADQREYESSPLPRYPAKAELQAVAASITPQQPTLLIETATVDTGERKDVFGHSARHVLTTRREVPLSRQKSEPRETHSDGWYIDLDTQIACDPWWHSAGAHAHVVATGYVAGQPGEVVVPTFRDIGTPETGFRIELTSTSRDALTQPDGTLRTVTSTWSMRVTELSMEPYDPALFDVPRGFRQVAQVNQNPPVPLSIRLLVLWQQLRQRIASFL